MPELLVPSFVVAVVFALVHLAPERLRSLVHAPRSRWLSMAGGIAVAYVFVHLLPELREHQRAIEAQIDAGLLVFLRDHLYLMALVGLVAFYGLEHAAVSAAQRREGTGESEEHAGQDVFLLHAAAYVTYNALIGYLLLHREGAGVVDLVFYAVAMVLHLLVNDGALEGHHGPLYRKYGRWFLAAAPLVGWGAGLVLDFDQVIVSSLFAFVAGGIILNVLKEELPEERSSRFPAFAGGATVYAVLLLATS
jgi:hypothetical protein